MDQSDALEGWSRLEDMDIQLWVPVEKAMEQSRSS